MKVQFLSKCAMLFLIMALSTIWHIKPESQRLIASIPVYSLEFSSLEEFIYLHMAVRRDEEQLEEAVRARVEALDFTALDTIHMLAGLPSDFRLANITVSENSILYLYMPIAGKPAMQAVSRSFANNQYIRLVLARHTHEVLEIDNKFDDLDLSELHEINLYDEVHIRAWSAGDFSMFGDIWEVQTMDKFFDVATAEPLAIKPVTAKVIVNGKPFEIQAYNIDGRSFFYLQDVEYALSGTASQFNTLLNDGVHGVHITADMSAEAPFLSSTGTTAIEESKKASHTFVYAEIKFDDWDWDLAALNMDGQYCFMLRHLAIILDFSVDWDNNERAILIKTHRKGAIT